MADFRNSTWSLPNGVALALDEALRRTGSTPALAKAEMRLRCVIFRMSVSEVEELFRRALANGENNPLADLDNFSAAM